MSAFERTMTTGIKNMSVRAPLAESNRFAFYVLSAGATLVRKSDNASVYFQPGDDANRATEEAEHCFAIPDMFPGEGVRLFNQWAAEYF